MSKKKLSKLLALYLPYVVIGLVATNLGEAWRLAVGKELGDKIVSLMDTLPAAFSNPLPSLHPLDLLVGLCCGAGLRLAVYLRGKNAKKYRHGMEYGSARWGMPKDIEPFMAPKFEDNIMLIVQDAVWGRVTANRSAGKSTRYYADEFHLLLKEEQTAAYSVEIWKRFRKWGGIPTALTQNVKDLLASPEVSNIFENSDFVYMLNQANGDRQILAKQLNISPHQLSYVTHSGEGEGLLFFGNVILPFVDHFPKDLELYRILTTRLSEVAEAQKHE